MIEPVKECHHLSTAAVSGRPEGIVGIAVGDIVLNRPDHSIRIVSSVSRMNVMKLNGLTGSHFRTTGYPVQERNSPPSLT